MRIVICCKEPLIGQALTSLLSHEGNFDVVALEAKAKACVSAAKDDMAQVILVDSTGLDKTELEFMMGARTYGAFGVVLLAGAGEDYGECGVDAIASRSGTADGLMQAIREVASAFVRTSISRVREGRKSYDNRFSLSQREFEAASLVAKGYSNRKISEAIGLKEQSVKNLVSTIMRKLRCENRVQVALRLSSANPDHGS